jgi:hypothetical protein
VTAHITSGCPEIVYPAASFTVTPGQRGSIRPIEVIYVKITPDRQAEGTFVVIPQSDAPDVHRTFPPMPAEGAGEG